MRIPEIPVSRLVSKAAVGVAFLVTGALSACQSQETKPDVPGARIEIGVAPLTLSGIDDVIYNLRVRNADEELVWSREAISSTRFGNGRGSLSYVGPCASTSNPNVVSLEIVDLIATGAAGAWQNPAPPGAPVELSVDCDENADVPVTFNLTIVRDANQGFFDIGVTFDNVFCSAKFDCRTENGDPMTLLHNPATQERDLTGVMALACTAGPGRQTYIYRSDLVVSCADGSTYRVRPTAGIGNIGPSLDGIYQAAVYAGREGFQNMEKCYWNVALGLDLAGLGPDCTVRGTATASATPFVDGAIPEGHIWPIIDFEVPLTDAGGALACDRSPLNGADGHVSTQYVQGGDNAFKRGFVCGDETFIDTPGNVCATLDIAGVNQEVEYQMGADGTLTIRAGNVTSGPMLLPDGLVATGCCADSCCD